MRFSASPLRSDLLPVFRTSPSMISDEGKGKSDVEEQAYGSADDRGAETDRGGAQGGRCGQRGGRVEAHAWKAKYGGMDVSQAQEAKQLRDENTRLRKLVADLSLDKDMLQAVIAKNGWGS